MGVIDSSALCLAKLPAPLMLNHSLGGQALCLPMREEDLPFYLGPYTPPNRMSLLSLFSLLHAFPILHPCQRAKSPLGTQLRLVSPLGWAKLGLWCLLPPPCSGRG